MSLIFVTGAPGSGKTAVREELSARGFSAYDTDDPDRTGMAGWHNLATGEYVAGYNEIEVTQDILDSHVWRLTDDAVDDFHKRAAGELIYLCGRLRDARSVIAVSDHVAFLAVSGETIRDRLAARAKIPGEVEWGREEWQIERSLEVNRTIEAEYRELGAVMINADQSLRSVVDELIDATAEAN